MELLKVLLLLDTEDAGYTSVHIKNSREKQFISFDFRCPNCILCDNINLITFFFQNLRCSYNYLLRFSYFFRKIRRLNSLFFKMKSIDIFLESLRILFLYKGKSLYITLEKHLCLSYMA